jgi:hypothetical protein
MGRCALIVAMFVASGCRPDPKDWEVYLADTDEPVDVFPALGVDLVTPLGLTLQNYELNSYSAPGHVRWTVDHPAAVEVTLGGVVPHGFAGAATEVDVHPTAPGANRIRFISDDIDERFDFNFTATPPTQGSIVITDQFADPIDDLVAIGPDVRVFASSSVTVLTNFTASGTKLLGRRQATVTAPTGSGTTIAGTKLTVGPAAHTFTLDTDLATTDLQGQVVTAGSIACIRTLYQQQKVTSLPLQVGMNVMVRPTPCDSQTIDIMGRPRPPYTIQVTGSAVTAAEDSDGEQIAVDAKQMGSASITITWSGATVMLPVQVQP